MCKYTFFRGNISRFQRFSGGIDVISLNKELLVKSFFVFFEVNIGTNFVFRFVLSKFAFNLCNIFFEGEIC